MSLAMIIISAIFRPSISVEKRSFTLKIRYGYYMATASAVLHLLVGLLEGDITEVVIWASLAILWGWLGRKFRDKDDDDKPRRRVLRQVGEKTKAKLKEMAGRLKPPPVRLPMPRPVGV